MQLSLLSMWTVLLWIFSARELLAAWGRKNHKLQSLSTLTVLAAAITFEMLERDILHEASTDIPVWAHVLQLLLITVISIGLFAANRRWSRNHITTGAIKESLDELPQGICFYEEDGRCILVNHKMNELCFKITGSALLNGNEFYEQVMKQPEIMLPDGTVQSFSHRKIPFREEMIHELTADDITEIHAKSEKLRRENEQLRGINEKMLAYGKNIDEMVMRKEILQAKMRIHNEMNHLILSTMRAMGPEGEGDRQAILLSWENNALLLCKEGEMNTKGNIAMDLETYASLVGLKILWEGTPDLWPVQAKELFVTAAKEAVTNAVKHASADWMVIRISEDEKHLYARFENDINGSGKPYTEGGGLKNLREKLEKSGGRMQAKLSERFYLTIEIKK